MGLWISKWRFANWSAYFLLLILFPIADFAESWTYTKSPESVIAPLGDEVAFTCQTNITAERVVWRHRRPVPPGHAPAPWTEVKLSGPNARNSSAHRITIKPNLSKLTVHLKNPSLAGEYRCVSWFGASGLASIVANLTVAKLNHTMPRIPDRRLVVAPDSVILIRCPPPDSEPPATMLYYKIVDKKHIPIDDDVDSAGGLVIRPKPGPPVTYTCIANNPFVNESHNYRHHITVEVKKKPPEIPIFTDDMVDKIIRKEGESITLGCSVIGSPAPRIIWKRSGGTLSSKQSSDSPLLHIPHLQLQDRGEYICHASNNVGTAEKIVHVEVIQPPQLVPEEYNETVQEGGTVRLPCGKISGVPTPTLHWLINGAEVIHDNSVKVLERALEINPVEKRHAGLIQCFATNNLGSAYTANLLQVIPKQHISQHNIPDLNFTGNEKLNRKRKPNREKVMVPPSRPNVTRLSDESVMVRWSVQNGGLPIKFFKVQYRDLNRTISSRDYDRGSRWNTTTEIIEPHIRSYAVDGLTPEHVYKFRVAAVYSNDDNKQGQNSIKFFLQRGSEVSKPPRSPNFTHAEAKSPTEILVYWQLSGNASKDIPEPDGFYVYYRPATSAAEYIKAAVEGGNTRSQLLNHLQPGTAYEIKLQSFTPMVASNFSAIITQKTLKSAVKKNHDPISLINGAPSVGVSSGAASNNLPLYSIIGGTLGGLLILAFCVGTVLCIKRCSNEKQDNTIAGVVKNSSLNLDGANGYLSSVQTNSNKPTITITTNPLHPESGNIDMEMSYISVENNNRSALFRQNSTDRPPATPSSC